eukprot:447601-Alexandrium_andersonii.AAC.1
MGWQGDRVGLADERASQRRGGDHELSSKCLAQHKLRAAAQVQDSPQAARDRALQNGREVEPGRPHPLAHGRLRRPQRGTS